MRSTMILPASHMEKLVSALGGTLGILGILLVSNAALGLQQSTMIVASMGASAVLLFAAPHSPMSQPWPVFGGHVISATIGVTIAKSVGDPLIACALAVGLAIGVMYYLGCLHPPGGASALAAVTSGPAVHALGYTFVITPVLLNVLVILVVAIAFNFVFPWRRYPQRLAARFASSADGMPGEKCLIAHSDLVYALSELDSFIDVSEEDLLRIYDLAINHSDKTPG